MNQAQLLAYVDQHLPAELRLMQTGGYASAHPELTAPEKALVYYYTASGSARINRLLHAGQPTILTEQLVAATQKLPTYRGSAYSAAHLSPNELQRLRVAAATGTTLLAAGSIAWPAFLSASRSLRVARWHLDHTGPPTPLNCLFLLNSLRGRAVEQLSHYGPNGPDPLDSEQEILFLPNTQFQVVGADFAATRPVIELLEL